MKLFNKTKLQSILIYSFLSVISIGIIFGCANKVQKSYPLNSTSERHSERQKVKYYRSSSTNKAAEQHCEQGLAFFKEGNKEKAQEHFLKAEQLLRNKRNEARSKQVES